MTYEKLNHAIKWAELVDANEAVSRERDPYAKSRGASASKLALGMYKLYCFCERLRDDYAAPWITFSAVEAGRLYVIIIGSPLRRRKWRCVIYFMFSIKSLLLSGFLTKSWRLSETGARTGMFGQSF